MVQWAYKTIGGNNMYYDRLRKPTKDAFKQLMHDEGVTELQGINNPVRQMEGYIVLYLLYKEKTYECMLDNEDIPNISFGNTWVGRGRKDRDEIYAVCQANGKVQHMHSLLCQKAPNQVIHHIDGNPLNNRRGNLSSTSPAMNMFDKGCYKNSTTDHTNLIFRQGYYYTSLTFKFKNEQLAADAAADARNIINVYLKADIIARDNL